MTVAIKRVYQPASRSDGERVLVDRLWPRGLAKAGAAIDEWLRDLAPSDELRRWYHARPDHWANFRGKYLQELSEPEAEKALRRLYHLAHQRKRLTLLFASKNETDRKSTRLNSSHLGISYAVFCLKKKKTKTNKQKEDQRGSMSIPRPHRQTER